ncbi:MAG: glycosyltransferase family 4 protein [Magnetococcus sp. DMHC-6]
MAVVPIRKPRLSFRRGQTPSHVVTVHIALVLIQYKPFGGYERQAKLLADALLAKGHEVTIVSSRWTGIEQAGLHFLKIPILKGASWLKVASFAFFTYVYLKHFRHRFDQVIAFDRSLGMDSYRAGNGCHRAWLATRWRHQGLKDRLSIAINPLHPIVNRLEKAIFQSIEEKNGTVIVLAPSGIEQIRTYYPLSLHRFIIIPPAVDFSRFQGQFDDHFRRQQRALFGIGDDDNVLLHVGSGFRIKGVERIIGALPFLVNSPSKIILMVIGSDKKGQYRCLQLAKKLGVEKQVTFVGGVEDVGRFYAVANLFLLLSLLETFGAVVAEALWFGLPIILGVGVGATGLINSESIGRVVDLEMGPENLAKLITECLAAEQIAIKTGKRWDLQHQRRLIAQQCQSDLVINRYLQWIEKTHV